MTIEVYTQDLKTELENNGYKVLQTNTDIKGTTFWVMHSNGCFFDIGEKFAGQYKTCENLRLTF